MSAVTGGGGAIPLNMVKQADQREDLRKSMSGADASSAATMLAPLNYRVLFWISAKGLKTAVLPGFQNPQFSMLCLAAAAVRPFHRESQ